ncbi:MAG: SGNH/GDSL hydrolase family protein [Steroidobacteraceae bacterium]
MIRMRQWMAALSFCAALAACSGSSDGDQSARVSYDRLVIFGDSLSDVGTYQVSTIAAIGGGQYTVNSGGGTNWSQVLASQLGVDEPCAEMTGLDSVIAAIPAVAVSTHDGCYSYAQGGARVTNPVGPGNIALWLYYSESSGQLGQLTVPIVTQIGNHLAAVGGSFDSSDLVAVLAGGNDVFINLATVESTIEQYTQAGADAATIAAAAEQAAADAVTAMGTAGAEEAAYIKTLILANGAKRVVVLNVPDMSLIPMVQALDTDTQALVNTMVATFNAQLAAGLSGTDDTVLQVDLYTQSQAQFSNPSQYGLSNVTTPACDLTDSRGQTTTAALLLAATQTSLLCTTDTTLDTDVSRYQYADTVHPTPYAHQQIAQLVATRMAQKGWL